MLVCVKKNPSTRIGIHIYIYIWICHENDIFILVWYKGLVYTLHEFGHDMVKGVTYKDQSGLGTGIYIYTYMHLNIPGADSGGEAHLARTSPP